MSNLKLHHRGVSLTDTLVADRTDSSVSVSSTQDRSSPKPRPLPRTIPPQHMNRTLVLCFDGTGDQFDADNSNIVQLFSMLKKDDRNKQMVYYQVQSPT